MVRATALFFAALLLVACVGTGVHVSYSGSPPLSGRICKPKGSGPFPAVIFNHGGLGTKIGGAPEETCAALAEAGYVGFSPIRRQTRPLFGHLDDLGAALKYVKSLSIVDKARIGMIGFSRGAMLAYQCAAGRSDINALVLMAAAAGRRGDGLTSVDAASISVPILMMVAENDTGSRTTLGGNVKGHMTELAAHLKAAGRDHRLIIYPPHAGDGHQLFFRVDAYWPDVTAFLDRHLKR
ncbi:MAG: dienelactone hydrolase family protein [Pseudomonadota bacterium]|nr:dienelactone hydrolase family protein [Pseudomonadota bacterium]